MSESVISDMFDSTGVSLDVDIDVPETKLKKTEQKKEDSKIKTVEPAYKVVGKKFLSESEYEILYTAIEAFDSLIEDYKAMDEQFVRDCSQYKSGLLDILAKKFGYIDAELAHSDGLQFKLKNSYEIELIKKREDSPENEQEV